MVLKENYSGVHARESTHGQTKFLGFHIIDLPPSCNGKIVWISYNLWVCAFYWGGSCTEYPET